MVGWQLQEQSCSLSPSRLEGNAKARGGELQQVGALRRPMLK